MRPRNTKQHRPKTAESQTELRATTARLAPVNMHAWWSWQLAMTSLTGARDQWRIGSSLDAAVAAARRTKHS